MEHRVTSGTVLSETFTVFFANFVSFILLVGLILVPVLALEAWITIRYVEQPDLMLERAILLLRVIQMILGPLATGALAYGVFQQVRGRPAPVGDCLATGFRRLLPVLGVAIVSVIVVFIGTLLCLIPGIFAQLILAVAVPAAVIEKTGVLDSLKRSRDLTEGNLWTVFGVIFAIGLLNGGVGFLVGRFAPTVGSYLFLDGVFTVVFTGLQATSLSLLYYHLRKAKEAIDVEEIAAVFD